MAAPVAQTYGSDDQTVAFFDTMCCQAGGTPIDRHAPELGAAWSVEGATSDADKPKVQTFRLNFEPGASAVAVNAGPSGERTLRAVVWEPRDHVSDVTLYLIERYADAQNYAALRLRWTPPTGDAGGALVVTAVAVESGAQTTLLPLATLAAAGHDRQVPVEIVSVPEGDGHTWTVWVDGVAMGAVAVPGLHGEPRFALAAETAASVNGGYLARVESVVVTEPAAPAAVCPGLRGWTAEGCVRERYAALRVHGYDRARDHLFETVWTQRGSGTAGDAVWSVEGVYGGLVRSWSRTTALSPREQMQDQEFNTEHVWPRSRGAQPGPSTAAPAHNDLHHLAPAYGPFNSSRSNRPFGDDFDQPDDTHKWHRNATTRYSSSGPPSDPAEWSRVERDVTRQSGDGYESLAELGRFDVRHRVRGDVARQAAYFLATYRIEAEDGDEGRAFIDATLDVLLDWHEQDPVDAAEVQRNERVYRVQGNRNPFVLDPTLVRRTFYQGADQPRSREVWINEVHHSNDGPDQDEGVEIAGRAGTDLYGYRVWTYSGYGRGYPVDADGDDIAATPAIALRGTIDDEGGGLGAVWRGARRLRSGCQGLALTDPDGVVLQFLSTGGCQFNATEGPVFDAAEAVAPGAGAPSHPDSLAWSTPVRGRRQPNGAHRRVQQWSTLPRGHTIQLSGAGRAPDDFTWAGPLPHSRGRLNDYQAPGARLGAPSVSRQAGEANAVTGWSAGDDVPLGVLAPAQDTGYDEDAPGRPGTTDNAEPHAVLAVAPPAPNPARQTTRLRVAAPPGGAVQAVVYDALGRAVARYDAVVGDLVIDVSGLATGAYVVRVTAADGRPGAPRASTHRLTVLR